MAERTYLYGYGSGPWGSATRKTQAQILATSSFDRVDREHMRRLFALADHCLDRGREFGFGGGDRAFAAQDAEFRRRHYVVPCPGGIWKYDYKCWQRHDWAAPFAPPGNSWHEELSGVNGALAVDALGDHNFAGPIAGQFGLKNMIAGEAWHYQPIEVPNARKYGQVWPALAVWGAPPPPPPTPPPTPGDDDMLTDHPIPHRIYSTRPADGAIVTGTPIPAGGGTLRIPVPFATDVDVARFQITVAPIAPDGWVRVTRADYNPQDPTFKHSNVNWGLGVPESSPVEITLVNSEFKVYCSAATDLIIDWLAYHKRV